MTSGANSEVAQEKPTERVRRRQKKKAQNMAKY